MTAQTTTWPEGVVARYLTIAGAALRDPNLCVEVTEHEDDYDTARCAACHAIARYSMDSARYAAKRRDGSSGPTLLLPDEPSRLAWEWAQAHAEMCRAMPRPAA